MKRIDVDEARRLMRNGALVVDVLPEPTYASQHIPGAVNIPLSTLDEQAVAGMDRDQPMVVYCFDQRCDLSARASARFDQLGFSAVHDLIGGRAAWTVLGLPTEGEVGDRAWACRHLHDPPSVSVTAAISDARAASGRADGPVAVLDDAGILLGSLDSAALALPEDAPVERAMVPAPGTIRPDVPLDEALEQLRGDGLAFSYVSTARGELLGVLRRDDHV
jgi:rhodanese-related sulfurtransferase